eukprot:gene4058-4305_t
MELSSIAPDERQQGSAAANNGRGIPKFTWHVRCRMLEIRGDDVYDLLQPGSAPLKVTENLLSGVQVEGLSEAALDTAEQTLQVLQAGLANRLSQAAADPVVPHSSHCIVSYHFESRLETPSGLVNVQSSRLHIIDVAALTEQGLLGGTTRTVFIANLSTLPACLPNTLNTLGLAKLARRMVTKAVEGEDASCGLVGRSTAELKLAGSHGACSSSSPSGSAGPGTSVIAGLPSCTAASTATASAESGQHQLHHEVALQQAMLLLEELSDKNTELEMALQGSERQRQELQQRCLDHHQEAAAVPSALPQLGQLTGAIAAAGKLLEQKQGLVRQQLKVPLLPPSSAATRATPMLLQLREALDLLNCCLAELAGQSTAPAGGSDAGASGDQLLASESDSKATTVNELCKRLLVLSQQHDQEAGDISCESSSTSLYSAPVFELYQQLQLERSVTARLQDQVQELKQQLQLADGMQQHEYLPDAAVELGSLAGQVHSDSLPAPHQAEQQQQLMIEQPAMRDLSNTALACTSIDAGTPDTGSRARMAALQQQLAQLQVQMEAATKERAGLRHRMANARGSAIVEGTGAAGLGSLQHDQPEDASKSPDLLEVADKQQGGAGSCNTSTENKGQPGAHVPLSFISSKCGGRPSSSDNASRRTGSGSRPAHGRRCSRRQEEPVSSAGGKRARRKWCLAAVHTGFGKDSSAREGTSSVASKVRSWLVKATARGPMPEAAAWQAGHDQLNEHLSRQLQDMTSANSSLQETLQQQENTLAEQELKLEQQCHHLECSDFIIQELQERLASHMALLSSAQSELIWTKGQASCLEHFNEHLQLQLDLQEQEVHELRQSLHRALTSGGAGDLTAALTGPLALDPTGCDIRSCRTHLQRSRSMPGTICFLERTTSPQASMLPPSGDMSAAATAGLSAESSHAALMDPVQPHSADTFPPAKVPPAQDTCPAAAAMPATHDADTVTANEHPEHAPLEADCSTDCVHTQQDLQGTSVVLATSTKAELQMLLKSGCSTPAASRQLLQQTALLDKQPSNTRVAAEQAALLRRQADAMGLQLGRQKLQATLVQMQAKVKRLQQCHERQNARQDSRQPRQPKAAHQRQSSNKPSLHPLRTNLLKVEPCSRGSLGRSLDMQPPAGAARQQLQLSEAMSAGWRASRSGAGVAAAELHTRSCGAEQLLMHRHPIDISWTHSGGNRHRTMVVAFGRSTSVPPEPVLRSSRTAAHDLSSSPASARSSSSVNSLLGDFVGQLQAFAQQSHQASSYKAASATALASLQHNVHHGKRQVMSGEAGGILARAGSLPKASASSEGGGMHQPDPASALQMRLQVVSAHELEAVHGLLHAGAAAVNLQAMLAEDKARSSAGSINMNQTRRKPLLKVAVPDVVAAPATLGGAEVEKASQPSVLATPDRGGHTISASGARSSSANKAAGQGSCASCVADVARSLLPAFHSPAHQAACQMDEASAHGTAAGGNVMPAGPEPEWDGTPPLPHEERLQQPMPHAMWGWSHSNVTQAAANSTLCVTQQQTWLLILQVLEEQQQRIMEVMSRAADAQQAGGDSASDVAGAVSGLHRVQEQLMQHMAEAKMMLASAGIHVAVAGSTAVASALQQQCSESVSAVQDVSIAGCIPELPAGCFKQDQHLDSPRGALFGSSGRSWSATGKAPSRSRDRVTGQRRSECGDRAIQAGDAAGTSAAAAANRHSDDAAGFGAEFEFSDQQQAVGVVDEQQLRDSCKFDRLQFMLQERMQQATTDNSVGVVCEADNNAAALLQQASTRRRWSAAAAGDGSQASAKNRLPPACAAEMRRDLGAGNEQVDAAAAAAAAVAAATPDTADDAGAEVIRLRGELLRVQLQLQQQLIRAQVAEGLRHQAWQGVAALHQTSMTAGDIEQKAGNEVSGLRYGVPDQTEADVTQPAMPPGNSSKASGSVEQFEGPDGKGRDDSDAQAASAAAVTQTRLPRLIPAGFFSPRAGSSKLPGASGDPDAAAADAASSPCGGVMDPLSSSSAMLIGKVRELQSKVMALRFVNCQLQDRIQKQDMQLKQQALSQASAAALTSAYSAAEAITNGSRSSLSGQAACVGRAEAAAIGSTAGWNSPASLGSICSVPASAASHMGTTAWGGLSGCSSPLKMTAGRSPLGTMPLLGGAFGSNPIFWQTPWSGMASNSDDYYQQQASPDSPSSSYCTDHSEDSCAVPTGVDGAAGCTSESTQQELSMPWLPGSSNPGLDESAVVGTVPSCLQQRSRLSAHGGSEASMSNRQLTDLLDHAVDDEAVSSVLQGTPAGPPPNTGPCSASCPPMKSSEPEQTCQLPEQQRKPLQVFHRSAPQIPLMMHDTRSSAATSGRSKVHSGGSQGVKLTAATRARQRRQFLVQHRHGGTIIDRLGE